MLGALVRELLDELAASDKASVAQALSDASLLLEQQWKWETGVEVRYMGPRRSLAARRRDIPASYRGLLPDQYIGLMLSAEEVNTLTDTLFAMVDASNPLRGSAIGALKYCRRLRVVPRLCQVALQTMTSDPLIAQSCVFTIGHLVANHRPNALTAYTASELPILQQALATMAEVAAHGATDGIWNVAEVASQEHASLARLISPGSIRGEGT